MHLGGGSGEGLRLASEITLRLDRQVGVQPDRPRWDPERELQMEAISERAVQLAGSEGRPALPSTVTGDSDGEEVQPA